MKTLKTFLLDHVSLRGKHFAFERNDCAVRAMMVLLEVSYSAAHTIMHLNGRNDAVRWSGKFIQALESAGGKSVVRYKSTTVENFVARHQEGRFLIWIHGHAFALIDGVCFDTIEVRPRHKILFAWQFPDNII